MTTALIIAATLTAATAVSWAGLYLADMARAWRADLRFLRGETDDLDAPAPLLGTHRARVETTLAIAMSVSGLAAVAAFASLLLAASEGTADLAITNTIDAATIREFLNVGAPEGVDR
ncbi:MAG: hypothetical protein Q3999_05180 [Buchananella hordeovulneris]|nr:hypothetical protein [Buchananella hordeovulneris]